SRFNRLERHSRFLASSIRVLSFVRALAGACVALVQTDPVRARREHVLKTSRRLIETSRAAPAFSRGGATGQDAGGARLPSKLRATERTAIGRGGAPSTASRAGGFSGARVSSSDPSSVRTARTTSSKSASS